MENQEPQRPYDQLLRLAGLVIGIVVVVMGITPYIFHLAWDAFASDLHIPALSFAGALGLMVALEIVLALIVAAYLVGIKDRE